MKLRRILSVLGFCGLVLLLSGCKMVVLDPKGIIAVHEKHLMIDAILLMLIVVIPVFIATAVICIRYRASNSKAAYRPKWSHSYLLEGVWWFIPCVIIVILATLTWRTTHALDPYKPLQGNMLTGAKNTKPVTIQAIALRWKWLFIYPKQGIATVNYINFPAHRPVRFFITSDAPMNSFQIPQLAGQIYAMNGMQTKLHIMANEPGVYAGRSVSFSGGYFAGMKFNAHVGTEKQFSEWVSKVKRSSRNRLTMAKYEELVKPSKYVKPMYFGKVDKNLFHKIIQKFMRPDRHHIKKDFKGIQL